ncbi:type II toxin-antitoxin system RelE/ParE family toxin [Sedimentitalea todarodis]|uniref:Type II toxin-antitoxin system RelE/ParE family toxin n=1 Tax=Sedimentitalea todarodis TaxID=1631240 RepID=A0ABU3VH42_9RHOB|nr:type II toxin-antitoxin system RelE/ParE family toxin [Sedimentitalea todarodis]MDU9005486.1 type II toxin-antitoxin system RelE/ParE family toxin [Sedimentitalea todarodis]
MPSGYSIVRSLQCDEDLELIFDHLLDAYQDLGDTLDVALDRAATRLFGIEDDLESLGEVPFQGTLEPRIMEGLRHVTKSRAVFYFTIDETNETLRVLGVFFGGQDHIRHILARIASDQL